jgi:hypothetical protein
LLKIVNNPPGEIKQLNYMKIIKTLIHKLKRTFSYSYRIKKGWGLTAVRNGRELKAIVEFCREELKDVEDMEVNPDRKKVYEMTVLLYEQGLSDDKNVFTKLHDFNIPKQTRFNDVEEFINEYVGWYWN